MNYDEYGSILPDNYEMNLSDFALFLSVMKHKEAYENCLSIIMNEKDLALKDVHVEEVVLNKSGKRAIRLDAWALDIKQRQFDMEMQNDTAQDDVRKRSRFYQGILDTPILKSGKDTKYRNLPSTVIIFITQEDIFRQDLAMYTFTEQCEEIPGLHLDDGTKKLFLNMSSKNGRPELVSLLQYMKKTTLDNPDILVKDQRIEMLDEIVNEVRQSEEWEAVKMSILEIGLEKGETIGTQKKLIQVICKKVKKNKSPEVIAEELEEDLTVIEPIYRVVVKYGTESDMEKLYESVESELKTGSQ